MSLYGNESESSGPSILLFLAILFAVGGGLGFFVQKRLSNTSNKSELLKDAAIATEHISQLRAQHARVEETLQSSADLAKSQDLQIGQIRKQIDSLKHDYEQRLAHRENLRREFKKISEDFPEYRERYRTKIRNEAVNEQWAEIKTIKGKSYFNVTIRKVTADGIEFTHSTGISRLPCSSLDNTWHTRFQW